MKRFLLFAFVLGCLNTEATLPEHPIDASFSSPWPDVRRIGVKDASMVDGDAFGLEASDGGELVPDGDQAETSDGGELVPDGGDASIGDADASFRDAAPAPNDVEAGSAECPRGCALQGHAACWPVREHPSFDVLYGGFVVRDRCTGLEWEAQINANSTYYTFADAETACANKNLPVPKGSDAKWRMPTRLELATILDFSLGGPVLDTRAFWSSLDQFWTSTKTPDGASAWTWTMYQGALQVKRQTSSYYGRCVRDSLGDVYDTSTLAHVALVAVGEAYDRATMLTWETGDGQNASLRSLASGETYCGSKGTGWRVPTLKELLTVLEEDLAGSGVAAVNSAIFAGAMAGFYWTETIVYNGGSTANHWAVDFGTGVPSSQQAAYVRCVKGG